MFEKANCVAASPAAFDLEDAYYSARISVTPGPAFAAAGPSLDKSAGKVLDNIVKSLFDVKKAKSLSLVWQPELAGELYPAQTLISFTRTDRGSWSSTVNRVDETLLHQLGKNPKAKIHLIYLYSDQPNIDLTASRDLLAKAVPVVAGDAAAPVFAAVQNVATAALRTGTVQLSDEASDLLEPAEGKKVSMTIEIRDPAAKDPGDAAVIATAVIELRGTRSLFHSSADFSGMAATLPDDAIPSKKLNELTSYVISGTPSKWPSVYSALASIAAASPIGAAPSVAPADIKKFCDNASEQIGKDYPFSSIDALLLQATVVELVTRSVRSQVNPYQICFANAHDRGVIAAKLGYDTDYAIKIDPITVTGLKDVQLLKTAAAWFTSKDCSDDAISNSPLATYLADTVNLVALEVPDSNKLRTMPVVDPSAANRTVSRAAFVAASCGSFPYWNTMNAQAGQIRFSLSASDPGWLASGNLSSGKITDFSIRK